MRALYATGSDAEIYIGQGWWGKTFDDLGIGRCCKGTSRCVMGCPPTAEQIANVLEEFMWTGGLE